MESPELLVVHRAPPRAARRRDGVGLIVEAAVAPEVVVVAALLLECRLRGGSVAVRELQETAQRIFKAAGTKFLIGNHDRIL